MNIALLLIDIQNDYFPGGTMQLEGSDQAADAAATLLRTFRKKKLPIMHIQHVATRAGSTFFLPDTEGVRIHAKVAPRDGEAVFIKHFPNSFRQTPLKDHLEKLGVRQLAVAGMMTHMCVDTTVRAAFDLGFSCLLAHDACATKTLAFNSQSVAANQVQIAYLAALHGLFADVRLAEEICRDICA